MNPAVVFGLFAAFALGMGMMYRLDNILIRALRADVDRERKTSERLMESVLTMRQQGFAQAKPATVREGPDPEGEGLARAEQNLIQRRDDAHFIQLAKTDIMRKNPAISDRAALKEAVRLRNEVMMEDPPA